MCKTKSGNVLDKTTYLHLYVASLWARHGARYQAFNITTRSGGPRSLMNGSVQHFK